MVTKKRDFIFLSGKLNFSAFTSNGVTFFSSQWPEKVLQVIPRVEKGRIFWFMRKQNPPVVKYFIDNEIGWISDESSMRIPGKRGKHFFFVIIENRTAKQFICQSARRRRINSS